MERLERLQKANKARRAELDDLTAQVLRDTLLWAMFTCADGTPAFDVFTG